MYLVNFTDMVIISAYMIVAVVIFAAMINCYQFIMMITSGYQKVLRQGAA